MTNHELLKDLLKRIEILEDKVKKLEGNEIKEEKPERGTYTKLVVDYINNEIENAKKQDKSYVELNAGEIQKAVGLKNRLPLVCNAMKKCMNRDCIIMHKTPSMQSSTLTIRWILKEEIRHD